MFRFYGGQVVKKGTYWNLSSGESIELEYEKVLPGNRQVRYLKVPTTGIFILGPISGLLFICLLPLMSLLIGITLLSRIAVASDALKSDEAAMCMGCHSTQGVVKTFKNKEKVSVYIEESHFKNTVHGFLTCTSCHSTVSMDNHPSAQYASKKEFATQLSKACKTCHSNEQVLARPIHKQAITRANAPPCSDCHGSHSISKVSGGKETASNSQYCLTCHKKDLNLSMKGETLSLTIDETILRKSVHGNHNCSDCHTQFSKKEHPLKTFGSKRELSISVAGVCKGCHPEKYKQYQGSIHSNMLMQGNLNAPVCTDCHGAHSVGHKALVETISGVPCRKCHEATFEAYKSSVHGQAKINGKSNAPICSSCHSAHEMRPALASRSPKATCMGCHKNAAELHKEWLPNSGIHLEAVACTACHVPDAERRVYLRVTDSDSGENISKARVKQFLGANYESLTLAKANGIEDQQLWDMYQKLGDSGTKMNLTGTLGLNDCNQSHMLAPKGKALKQCDKCHDADSKSFKAVSMAIITPNGHEERYNVNPAVLGSMFSILPLNQFYALGGTRIKILDIIGILMVVGGMSVPIVHITLRILTSPIREARRLNKLRKEGRR
ncbi:MAG: cytochrome c3 family protein [Thermodesulfovibrionales bacterium]